MKKLKALQALAVAMFLSGFLPQVHAASVTFAGTNGALAASATFTASNNFLIVTLSNTSTNDVLMQNNILTALFFDVSGPVLSLNAATGSAVVPSGSSVLFGSTDPGGVVGGEWEYLAGISNSVPTHQNYGISSSGFSIFGNANFPGSNLEGPAAVDGVQYGITSAGDNPTTGQSAVTGDNGLIQNTVVFTLPGLPTGFDPSTQISRVSWQYGTMLSPTDPTVTGSLVPEPGCGALVGIVGTLGFFLRRKVSF